MRIVFDIIIKPKEENLFHANIKYSTEFSNVLANMRKDKVHKLLGHSGGNYTVATAKLLGWYLTSLLH